MLKDECNVLINPEDAKKLATAEEEKSKVSEKVELVDQEEALQSGKAHVHWICERCMGSVGYCASCQSRANRTKKREEEDARKRQTGAEEKDKVEDAEAAAAATSIGYSASDK